MWDEVQSSFLQAQPPSLIQMQTPDQQIYTGVSVNLRFFPLAFLLYFCTPTVNINGVVQSCPWGNHYFELQPGVYQIRISFPYIFSSECGANSVEISLQYGEVRTVNYYMWPIIFLPGSINFY